MRYLEIFKLYNLKNSKKNRVSLLFISISLLITMTISFIIPQLELAKQNDLEDALNKSSKQDLMVVQSYPSQPFNNEMNNLAAEGTEMEIINYAPVYINENSNSIMVYLLSGYEDLEDNTVIISKKIADDYDIKIGDTIKLENISSDSEIKIAGIEYTPIDINDDAKVTGYIKTNNITPSYNSNTNIYLINSDNTEVVKKDLEELEPGFSYRTFEERSNAMYQQLDIQIASLNIIGIVGYVLAISVCLTGFTILLVRSKKDIANLIIMGIARKDVMKAFKIETYIVLFVPLILAIVLSIPISILLLANENISYVCNEASLLNLLSFSAFNIIVFIIYRNIAISSIKSMEILKVIKNENGILNRKFRLKLILGIVLIPFIICMYAILLKSGTSIMTSILLSIFLLLIIGVLYIMIWLLLKIPLWKHSRASLYISKSINPKKIIYVISIVNLSLLLLFIMIGFNLNSFLHDSVQDTVDNTLPYNLMMRSENTSELSSTLMKSKDVQNFTVLSYGDVVVQNDNVIDRKARINEIKEDEYDASFKMVEGDDVFTGSEEDIVIAKAYAKAYQFEVGSLLEINNNGVIETYRIKGIYDSGGINNNWILKASTGTFHQELYLVKSYDKEIVHEISNTLVADADVIGLYIKYQTESFLNSFKYICLLFSFASLVFNINLMKLLKDMDSKEDSIIRVLSFGNKLVVLKELVKMILISVLSILISTITFFGISKLIVEMFSMKSASISLNLIIIVLGIAFSFIVTSVIIPQNKKNNDLLNLKEE